MSCIVAPHVMSGIVLSTSMSSQYLEVKNRPKVKELVAFVHKHRIAHVTELHQGSMNEILETAASAAIPIFVAVHDKTHPLDKTQQADLLRFAKDVKGRVVVARVDLSADHDGSHKFMKDTLSLEDNSAFPTFRLFTRKAEGSGGVVKFKPADGVPFDYIRYSRVVAFALFVLCSCPCCVLRATCRNTEAEAIS